MAKTIAKLVVKGVIQEKMTLTVRNGYLKN